MKKSILIFEPDEDPRALYENIILKPYNVDVDLVSDGQYLLERVKAAGTGRYDLILTEYSEM